MEEYQQIVESEFDRMMRGLLAKPSRIFEEDKPVQEKRKSHGDTKLQSSESSKSQEIDSQNAPSGNSEITREISLSVASISSAETIVRTQPKKQSKSRNKQPSSVAAVSQNVNNDTSTKSVTKLSATKPSARPRKDLSVWKTVNLPPKRKSLPIATTAASATVATPQPERAIASSSSKPTPARRDSCAFCGRGDDVAAIVGGLTGVDGVKADIVVHEDCMLWSPKIFLNKRTGVMENVEKEIERGKFLKCCVCQQRGATVGCYRKQCRRNYHYLCAVNDGCFLDESTFEMFCADHRPEEVSDNAIEGAVCVFCGEAELALDAGGSDELLRDLDCGNCGVVNTHILCAEWSPRVYFDSDGALVNLETEIARSRSTKCYSCKLSGATIGCQTPTCRKSFHYPCAVSSGCALDASSFTLQCPQHKEAARRRAAVLPVQSAKKKASTARVAGGMTQRKKTQQTVLDPTLIGSCVRVAPKRRRVSEAEAVAGSSAEHADASLVERASDKAVASESSLRPVGSSVHADGQRDDSTGKRGHLSNSQERTDLEPATVDRATTSSTKRLSENGSASRTKKAKAAAKSVAVTVHASVADSEERMRVAAGIGDGETETAKAPQPQPPSDQIARTDWLAQFRCETASEEILAADAATPKYQSSWFSKPKSVADQTKATLMSEVGVDTRKTASTPADEPIELATVPLPSSRSIGSILLPFNFAKPSSRLPRSVPPTASVLDSSAMPTDPQLPSWTSAPPPPSSNTSWVQDLFGLSGEDNIDGDGLQLLPPPLD